MRSTPHRASHLAQKSLQRQGYATDAEYRGGPESSLLFSTAVTRNVQDVRGRRASDPGSAWQGGHKGVPPTTSKRAIHRKNHSRSTSEPLNHWPATSSTRGLMCCPQRRSSNPTPLPSVSDNLITYEHQPSDSMKNAQAANTHIVPPPLRRQVPIALPSLSLPLLVQIHPVVSYHYSSSNLYTPISWNVSLPPSTARLAVALGGISSSHWSCEVAVEPRTLMSMTIRIVGVNQPAVVFPAEMGNPIRIMDIFKAVYGALRFAIFESVDGLATGTVGVNYGSRSGVGVISEDAAVADAIRRYFRKDVWWGGLHESMEKEVWVLELRDAKSSWQ